MAATTICFTHSNSAPDDELITVASPSPLRNPGVLEQQVRRMLADARARRARGRNEEGYRVKPGVSRLAAKPLDSCAQTGHALDQLFDRYKFTSFVRRGHIAGTHHDDLFGQSTEVRRLGSKSNGGGLVTG
jgi:hypothetical protein